MLPAATILALAQECAINVHPQTMAAIVRVESSGNPFAIGVVKGRLARQPRNKDEAIATARALEQGGWNFSMGVGQVNRYNLAKYGLTYETVFEPCSNLKAASAILAECYQRAANSKAHKDNALGAALSCYYSGNFVTGYRHGYVQKVVARAQTAATASSAAATPKAMPIPAIPVIPNGQSGQSTAQPAAKAKLSVPAVKKAVVPAAATEASTHDIAAPPVSPPSEHQRNPALVF